MRKEKAREWLEAVRKLSAYYREEHNDCKWYGCPFCKIDRLHGCKDCLWKLYSRMHCIRYAELYFNVDDVVELRYDRDPRWVRLSLARLNRWEKRLLKIIKATP